MNRIQVKTRGCFRDDLIELASLSGLRDLLAKSFSVVNLDGSTLTECDQAAANAVDYIMTDICQVEPSEFGFLASIPCRPAALTQ